MSAFRTILVALVGLIGFCSTLVLIAAVWRAERQAKAREKRERRDAEQLMAEAFMDNATVEAVRQAIEREREAEMALEHYRAQVAQIAVWQ